MKKLLIPLIAAFAANTVSAAAPRHDMTIVELSLIHI